MKNSIDVPITLENENEKRHLLASSYQGVEGDLVYEKKLEKYIT